MKLAAVTGARGLIGRYIVKNLLEAGWQVRILSRTEKHLSGNPNVQIIVADIKNKAALEQLLEGASAVFHCAAELHDEAEMDRVNVKGTLALLDSLSRVHVKYFCYLSSAGVVGPSSAALVDEFTPCFPSNTYEQTKYEAEKLVLHANLNTNVCILRPTNVFDVNKKGLVNLAIKHSFKNKMTLFLKGNEGAHLVHAKDVAAAALFFINHHFHNPEIFFVSYDNDQRNTILGVCKLYYAINHLEAGHFNWALPYFIPYIIRKFIKGKSLHGKVRFSEKKLRHAGFEFPLNLKEALVEISNIHKGNN